jgi:DNA invertase Pin-like site-specific DNA recombinase
MSNSKIKPHHLQRRALLYIRQSSAFQVLHNEESRRLQYAMADRVRSLGWRDVEIIDEDLGRSATTTAGRTGFQYLVAEVCLGKVGAVVAREVSRFARNNRDWHQLIEMCSLVDTVLIDHDTVYDGRQSNDRLLLGLKGSLSEYELDLLRQRSLEARRQKAARGELVILAPVGYLKTADDRLEKDPNHRVQRALRRVFDKFLELGTVRQTANSQAHGATPSQGHGARETSGTTRRRLPRNSFFVHGAKSRFRTTPSLRFSQGHGATGARRDGGGDGLPIGPDVRVGVAFALEDGVVAWWRG